MEDLFWGFVLFSSISFLIHEMHPGHVCEAEVNLFIFPLSFKFIR